MPSLGSTLSIAATGLRAQQQAMDVTAHNLANASAEGYARQRAVLRAGQALYTPDGVFGTGVTVADVQRLADPLADAVYHRESGFSTRHRSRADLLERIEGVLGEPSDTGLAAALDRFHSAWSDLAANPTSAPVRAVVRQTGATLATKFRDLATNLDAVRQDIETRLAAAAEEANGILADVATLNRRIVAAESGGKTAGDLRDRRAELVDRLAGLLPVQAVEQDDGSIIVSANGQSLVDGAAAQTVEVRTAGGALSVGVQGRTAAIPLTGGAMAGLADAANTDLPVIRQTLDDLASALVTEVNAVHTTGTNPLGATGVDFFDPAGTTASSIGLSAAVQADAEAIAAGTPDSSGGYRAGANDVAEALAGLRDATVASLGDTLGETFRGLVSDLGQAVRSTRDTAETHEVLTEQAQLRRMSLSGVSVDEELVRMIQFQSAYQAAARIVTAVDEMIQSLLAV